MSSLEDEVTAKCVCGWAFQKAPAVMLLSCVMRKGGAVSYLDRNSQCSEFPFSHFAPVYAGKLMDCVLNLDTALFFHILSNSFMIDYYVVIRYYVVWLTNGVKVQANE